MKVLDNLGNQYSVIVERETYSLNRQKISVGVKYIDFIDESLFAKSGEDGYYIIADADKKGSRLCSFKKPLNTERVYKQDLMPIFGVKNTTICSLFIVEGCKFEFHLVFGEKNGEYYIYPRFIFDGAAPYEDIIIRRIDLDKTATFSDMAIEYRNYQLKNGNCRPLLDKIKERPLLDYAMKAPEIRIRMGWKPVPSPVMEQTVENEPEMKVACTFDRVCDIIDELKRQGVDKAQICLVGWNKSGHDGRYPDMFPVEEKLGGEERLLNLVQYAKKNGYQIVCHTNSTDCYSISERFSKDIVIKK